MKDSMTWLCIGVLVLLALAICFVSGCAATPPPDPLPDTATKVLTKFVLAPDLFFTLTIVGIMAGVFAFLNGQKIGIPLIITCFVGLCMKLAVVRFGFWIGLCGALGSLGLLVYTIMMKDRAIKEVIQGVQLHRNATIEHKDLDCRLGLTQSKSTKKLVEKVKKGIK